MIPMLYTPTLITLVFSDGTVRSVTHNDPYWDTLQTAIKEDAPEERLREIVTPIKAIASYVNGVVEIRNGELFFEGNALHSVLASKIVAMHSEGFNIDPLVAFLRNLFNNPSRTAVEELYLFLEANQMPITPDGCFLAYKAVRDDYKDFHTGTIDNSIGATPPPMPRNKVCDNRNITCAEGYHFAARKYAESFRSGGHLMILKVNPADVVSIPSDYNNTKGRCTGYTVIGEVPRERTSADDKFRAAVYDDTDDYDDDSYEDESYENETCNFWCP